MKKLNTIACLFLLIMPPFLGAMEKPDGYESVEQAEQYSSWAALPDEAKLNILSFVVNPSDISTFERFFKAISTEGTCAIDPSYLFYGATTAIYIADETVKEVFAEILQRLNTLRLVNRDMESLALDNQVLSDIELIMKYCIKQKLYLLKKILRSAVKGGYANMLLLGLNNGLIPGKMDDFDVHTKTYLTDEFMTFASRAHNTKACQKLIEAGVLSGIKNAELAEAIYLHNYEAVESLIKNGIKVKLPNDYTELMIAVTTRNLTIIELILKLCGMYRGSTFNFTPLMIAAQLGDVGTMELLLNNGADVNKSGKGATPLNFAVKSKKVKAVKFLVENGAIFDTKRNDGTTIIMDAAYHGDVETVKYFIDLGIDPYAIARDKRTTALSIAKNCNHLKLVKFLEDLSLSN